MSYGVPTIARVSVTTGLDPGDWRQVVGSLRHQTQYEVDPGLEEYGRYRFARAFYWPDVRCREQSERDSGCAEIPPGVRQWIPQHY